MKEEDQAIVQHAFDRVKQGESKAKYENGLMTRSRQIIDTEWQGFLYISRMGDWIILVLVWMLPNEKMEQELLERKRATEILANKMQTVFDSTADPIWAVDREHKLLFFNKSLQERIKRLYGEELVLGKAGAGW